MNNINPLDRIRLTNPVHFLALGFGSGLIRPAPGTWGTLTGLIIGALLLHWLGSFSFAILTALCFPAGCYLCGKTAADMGVHDHGAIVWDEIVAIFMVLPALPDLSWRWLLTAFVLFRFFDILKPYPIGHFDQKLKSGFGIMIDDVLAALYSIIIIVLIRHFS